MEYWGVRKRQPEEEPGARIQEGQGARHARARDSLEAQGTVGRKSRRAEDSANILAGSRRI
jgi:hypothetical protein